MQNKLTSNPVKDGYAIKGGALTVVNVNNVKRVQVNDKAVQFVNNNNVLVVDNLDINLHEPFTVTWFD